MPQSGDVGLAVVVVLITVAALVLFVLGVLMPWFVWRISVHVRDIRDSLGRIARDTEIVRKEIRAIANATTGSEPPIS